MATPVEGTESETVVDPNVETVQGDVTPGPNPNWESVLNLLPETLHSAVTPHFAEWDKAANSRIESLTEQYKPYESFREHGIGDEDLMAGLRLINMLNENPQEFYNQLAASLGANGIQQQQPTATPEVPATGEEGTPQLPPGYENLQQGVELMAQRMLDAENAQKQAQASAQLETDLKRIETKHGQFNPELFLPYLSTALDKGLTVDKAAESYFALQTQQFSQTQAAQPFAPKILGANSGGGTGLQSNAIDPTKLDSKQTKELVVEMLRRAAQQP